MSDLIEPMLIAKCRRTLEAYHADTLSVINGLGVGGACYDDVWLELNARLNAELDARAKTDGALYTLGEFLERIEGAQRCLDKGHVAMALAACLELVRIAHRLRGQMILRESTAQSRHSASGSRPGSRSTIRPKIIRVLKSYKIEDEMTLDDALNAWAELDSRHGLALEKVGKDSYTFYDENAAGSEDSEATYKYSSLSTMWKLARK